VVGTGHRVLAFSAVAVWHRMTERLLSRHERPAAGHGLHQALLDQDVDGAAHGPDSHSDLASQLRDRGQLGGDLAALDPLPAAGWRADGMGAAATLHPTTAARGSAWLGLGLGIGHRIAAGVAPSAAVGLVELVASDS
jgi:hypothetical protein